AHRHASHPRSLLITTALLLASCTARPAGLPVVRWGVDECSSCHMILGDERFVAVARLLRWNEERPAGTWKLWVHDAAGRDWLAADSAFFTRHTGLATPMGSGLRA